MWRLLGLVLLLALAAAQVAQAHPEPNDIDGDGVVNAADNCIDVLNGDQRDVDGDGRGDRCDTDADNDGVLNSAPDNCPLAANADQLDAGGDGVGDECDKDTDLDGRQDIVDNCPDLCNPAQLDNDRDGTGDLCDPDDDDDGVFDAVDNCDFVYNYEQVDLDRDGRGAGCDDDDTPVAASGGPGAATDTIAPDVALRFGRRLRFAAIRDGLVVRVRCSEACAVTVRLRVDRHSARRAGLRSGATVASGTAQVERAGTTFAFVRFRRPDQRRLWRAAPVSATLRVTAVDRAGNQRKLRRAVRIAR